MTTLRTPTAASPPLPRRASRHPRGRTRFRHQSCCCRARRRAWGTSLPTRAQQPRALRPTPAELGPSHSALRTKVSTDLTAEKKGATCALARARGATPTRTRIVCGKPRRLAAGKGRISAAKGLATGEPHEAPEQQQQQPEQHGQATHHNHTVRRLHPYYGVFFFQLDFLRLVVCSSWPERITRGPDEAGGGRG